MTAIILVLGCDSVCGLRPHTLSHPWHYSMLSFRVKRGIPIIFFSAFILYSIVIHSFASANNNGGYYLYMPPDSIYTADTLRPDTSEDKLQYPFPDNEGYPFSSTDISSPLYLNNPSNIKSDVEYNDKTGEYDFNEKIGEQYYRYPNSMTLEEYKNYDFDHAIRDYWNQKSSSESFSHQKSLLPTLHFGGEIFDRIFGSNVIDIRPQGSATLTFGIDISRVENPQLQERLRKTWTFNFEEQIEMNVTGQIGDKLKLACNYNTEASFEFENKMNLAYQGKEDEIIQKIEAGDVTLPLTGSLITGSQSLFGLKTELQFGRLTATSVFSQQKGKTSVIEVEGGATTNYFEVNCDDYEANKHFFLAQYFRNKYNDAMKSLPVIASDINITKIEVWITNKTGNYEESRNILSFMDLGEGISEQGVNNVFASNVITQSFQGTPRNESNNIYDVVINPNINNIRIFTGITTAMAPFAQSNFTGGQDYEKIESARLLSSSEYKLNARLGFISLNSALNADEILAVAYEYTTSDGKTYRVGELTPDGVSAPQTLIVKLLKATSLTPRLPTWKLMMKNVYALGAYQVNKEEFYLNIFYNDPKTGTPINYIPEPDIFSGHSLIQVLSLDKLNTQLEAFPDGVFDYIENYTISPSNGRIYFSVLEPFGDDLEKEFGTGNQAISSKYVFHELYDSTQSIARQIAEKNRFILKGSYRSASGSDISLNALNVPQGSVVVTASGRTLTENVDYTVDYSLGRVKIINQGLLESGTPIKISLENNSLFSIQSKTLLGTHLNYRISKNFNLGGTILRLTERPLTQKVNIGDEPISNTIWGIDGTYRTEAPFITKLVDKLPFLETKEASNVTINGEFAHLIPGHSRAIQKEGTAYIDDFEGCKTSLNIQSVSSWELASVPQGQSNIFHGGNRLNSLESGFYRAKLCWYIVERMLVSTTDNNALKNIPDEEKADHFVREVYENEIFPKKESATGIENQQLVLNFSFYPDEKGPYNYNVEGIDSSGNLLAPYSNWGGVMRKVETNDFEASNIEYIEFWLMDPFADPDNDGPKQPINSTGGYLYFHLGNVSEDILNDGRKMFENGLPTSQDISLVDTTIWGRVPMKQSLVTAFDNNPDSRPYQDVGLDGLNDDEENSFFGGGFHNYLENIQLRLTNDAYQKVLQDPSNDNFHYFRGSNQDGDDFESNDFYDNVLERYKKYNGLDGNSPTSKQTVEDYQTQATSAPDVEDINRDNNLSEVESYFQYEVPVFPGMDVGQSYITDKISNPVNVSINGNFIERSVTWYQFKIPIQIPDTVIGSILDFKSIRFIRLLLSGFSQDVVLRFATLDLVRGEWRKYKYSLREGGEWDPGQGDVSTGSFDISAVNIEENGKRDPIKYVLPPGINRVIDPSNPHMRQLNEQSIMLKAGNLPDGDARAAFKNVHLDVRQYKKLKMEVHAEAVGDEALNDGEMRAFIRLGSDYKQNYYEYEVPLTLTPIAVYSDDDNISEDDRLKIWPESNRIDFEFEILQRVKQMRNDEARKLGSLIQPGGYMEIWEGRNRVSINGNPNLSDIRTIMIGIRNPKATNNPHTDDGISKSVEVWFNELRLTDFDEKGGWAATARIATKLADFGTLNIAGNTSRRGFGSIEKKVNERSKEDIYQYDISSNLELGKFFPEKVRLSIPMYVGFSENIQNPQYNPLDPDIPLEAALDNAKTRQERDSIKHISQYYTRRKSLNFTNIKLNSSGGKPKPYSISNFGISYGFNSLDSRDITTEFNHERHYTGGLIYNFNTSPKEFIPFKKVKSKFMKSSWLKLITDFNINFMPNQISMRTDLVRNYRETKLRDIAAADVNVEIPITIKKDFNCNRVYDMKYDLTKGLKFDYNATNISRIVEPQGRVIRRFSNKGGSLDTVYLPYSEWVDSVRGNLINYQAPNDSIKQGWFGANYDFHQSVNVSYNVPVQKLPPFSWITMSARYRGDYDWLSGPLSRPEIGHTIKNSNNSQLNTQFNFLTVYNKIPYLKDLNQKSRRGQQPKKDEKKTEKVRYPEKGREEIKLKANIPKTINHKLNTSDVEMKVFDAQGKPVKGEFKVINENKGTFTAEQDYDNATFEITGTREVKISLFKKIFDHTLKVIMGVKNLSVNYSQTDGSILPGYMNRTQLFGMNGDLSPGIPYILGYTENDFGIHAGENGWLTNSEDLYEPFTLNHKEDWNIRSSVEPVTGMRIDVSATQSKMMNRTEYIQYDPVEEEWEAQNTIENGNFSMSFNTIGSAFERITSQKNYSSETFKTFNENRRIISERMALQRLESGNQNYGEVNPSGLDSAGYRQGYSGTSQDVLIPAFIAAYTGQTPQEVDLDMMPEMVSFKNKKLRLNIMPNWRITYDGLKNIKLLKKYLKTITVSHAYRCTYSVGNFSSNSTYMSLIQHKRPDSLNLVYDAENNFLPMYDVGSVSINEQFNPLIDIDMTWINSLITKIEIKRTRNIAFSLSNNWMTETSGNDYTLGTGYRIKSVPILINKKKFESDINLRADFSLRKTLTVIRKLQEEIDEITSGQNAYSVKLSADYVLNERFNIKIFYDWTGTRPKMSLTFPRYNTSFGISLRFTLTQL